MSGTKERLSVHSRKFYRVVLVSINTAQETPETFAIKMSMRLRAPFHRVRQVVQRLPYAIKSNLSVAQANRLKAMIEEIGGRVRLETHFATPGKKKGPEPKNDLALRGTGNELTPGEDKMQCPSCGWERDESATFCSLCHQRFGDATHGGGLGSEIPHDNPLEAQSFRRLAEAAPDEPGAIAPSGIWPRYKLPILIAGAAVLVLLLILFK